MIFLPGSNGQPLCPCLTDLSKPHGHDKLQMGRVCSLTVCLTGGENQNIREEPKMAPPLSISCHFSLFQLLLPLYTSILCLFCCTFIVILSTLVVKFAPLKCIVLRTEILSFNYYFDDKQILPGTEYAAK